MFYKLLVQIAQSLSQHSIHYMVIGGQAVLVYGEPRLTKDIDITLGINVDGLDEILKIVEKLDFKVLVKNPQEFVSDTMVLPTEDTKSGIKVDFIFSYSTFEREALVRANSILMDNTPVKFASLEDLAIHKIISGRPRDLEDVKNILLKNPDFDRPYIERWLSEFDKSLDEQFLNMFEKIVQELT